MSVAPTMYIKRFFKDYKPNKIDPAKMDEVDMIEYGPIGSPDKSLITCTIRSLRDVLPMTDRSNPAIVFAHARWEYIKPKYEAWKAGQEMPLDGTPISAWNGVTPEQAEVFKRNGVRTVEEISQLTDAHIERFPIAHMRQLIMQAKNFLTASDATRFAKVLSDREAQLKNQEIELNEQREQTKALLAKVDQLAEIVANGGKMEPEVEVAGESAVAPAPAKRRGRPPKAQVAA